MNAPAFAKMKPGAFFINVSRGNLADEAALEAVLASGRLAARERVIATPHTAGLTPQAIEHQSLETVAKAAEIAAGRVPKGAVNPDHWKRKELL